MAIKIYNTMTRQKEEFVPAEPNRVRIYVCGPTTYNYIHLGNARPIIFFDVVRRYFEYRQLAVLYVQNFTDIDDKIINRAREEKTDPMALAQKYINEYFKDADALNVRRADVHPRVSEHLPEVIEMITKLIDQGNAYVLSGDVYFSVRSFPTYGKLSGRPLEEMQAGARVEVDERKRDPMDFALWKAAKPGEPAWESPWGPGRPGWHIECSAMSLKYLGVNFDIHGGGFDLIFPHHENEICQTEACTGQPFARYWMHNGFITVNQEKMSKSLGNFFLVREILTKFNPEVVRFYLIATHYRSPLDFDDEKLRMSQKGLDRLKTTITLLQEALGRVNKGRTTPEESEMMLAAAVDQARRDFAEAMDDDFNTALAIAAIFELAREVNTYLGRGALIDAPAVEVLEKAQNAINDFGEILGILKPQESGDQQEMVEKLVNLLISLRQEARQKKDWSNADRIRDSLKEIGVVLEDTPQGVRWKRI